MVVGRSSRRSSSINGIGVGAGQTLSPAALSPEMGQAIIDGMVDAWNAFAESKKKFDAAEVMSWDMFGMRDYLKNLYRMAAAVTAPPLRRDAGNA